MLNKNNLLNNDKVVSKLLDMAFVYKGNITPEIKKEFFDLLKQEKFISDKVNGISLYVYARGRDENFRDGFNLTIVEYYNTRTSRNCISIYKERIDGWLGHEID